MLTSIRKHTLENTVLLEYGYLDWAVSQLVTKQTGTESCSLK